MPHESRLYLYTRRSTQVSQTLTGRDYKLSSIGRGGKKNFTEPRDLDYLCTLYARIKLQGDGDRDCFLSYANYFVTSQI